MKATLSLYANRNTTSNALKVEVEVIDYKEKFGRKMCLITPLKGEGKLWVNQDKVKIQK